MAGSCEHVDGTLGFIKRGKFLRWLRYGSYTSRIVRHVFTGF
jgi:hypothetical protein